MLRVVPGSIPGETLLLHAWEVSERRGKQEWGGWWSFGIFGWVSIVWGTTTTRKGTHPVVYLCLIIDNSQAPIDKVPIRFVDSHTFFQKFLIPACQDFSIHRTCLLASLPHINSQPYPRLLKISASKNFLSSGLYHHPTKRQKDIDSSFA
jgi:hypothetical protein